MHQQDIHLGRILNIDAKVSCIIQIFLVGYDGFDLPQPICTMLYKDNTEILSVAVPCLHAFLLGSVWRPDLRFRWGVLVYPRVGGPENNWIRNDSDIVGMG